jgi:CBS domain-containing protein
MRLFEIMSERVETVDSSTSAGDAWERMKRARIHHLVVMEGSRVVGVLSDRDLGGPNGARVRSGRSVADLMTPRVATATPETTVRQAANMLRGYVIGCLPVLEGKRLVGIVTITDLLDLIGRGVERPIRSPNRKTMKPKARGTRSAA